MLMKIISKILLALSILLCGSCVTEFVPKTTEDQELLVVEGLITNRPEAYTIKLSRPFHLGLNNVSHPLSGCIISVSDDLDNSFIFSETAPGTYTSDTTKFQGIIGRIYTLHISTNFTSNVLNYQSVPMELKTVPPIDSLYYEKVTFANGSDGSPTQQGARIYLDTHDPSNQCKFYRWEYSETWEFRLPYSVPNSLCWLSNNSDVINIKNTSVIAESKVDKYPMTLISNSTDRLREKYSIMVNQYSLNQDEYLYWEKLQNISEQVGGLYDIIPSAIPSNIYCLDDPNQKVLGYFSVSASSSKRIFIKDNFAGVLSQYNDRTCIADTVFGSPNEPIAWLGVNVWVIISHPIPPPSYRVLTRTKSCYDCTVMGTNIRPDFWVGDK
jgi:hypothetical protein